MHVHAVQEKSKSLTALDKAGKLFRAVPNFNSIRPYRDEEVPSVVRRLTASVELRDGIASFLFPRLYRFSAVATQHLTALLLSYQARKLRTVYDVQMMVGRFIDYMVEASVDDLSWSGLDSLQRERAYLFVSNHRDIALDSALLNRVLHEEGFPTCQIAVGDNLFGTPHADDLMRLNRGFLVQRMTGGPKAAYAALLQTSSYIKHSIDSGVSVWIAQREGRAKDGFDRTEPALIKMLALAWRKRKRAPKLEEVPAGPEPSQPAAGIARIDGLLGVVNIVPVSISYELDPCDLLKADELFQLATEGEFTKPVNADLESIAVGMRGYKGRVHLHFSEPLSGSFETAEDIATAMDQSIVGGLKVYPPNLSARAQLDTSGAVGENPLGVLTDVRESQALSFFEDRVAATAVVKRPYLLLQYANLLRNRVELGLSAEPARTNPVLR